MDHETALRFASSLSDDVKASDIEDALAEYFKWLSTCSVCNGTGSFTYGREYKFRTSTGMVAEYDSLEVGDTGPCPKCVGTEATDNSSPGDPDWVVWHCVDGDSDHNCQLRGEDGRPFAQHEQCGYRLLLPVPEKD